MVLTFAKRAVSLLHFEPLLPSPEEILCPGSSDEEDDLQGHRDKRQRIEAVGKKCLEGRPPFILTAGLRGPFEKEWKNPWAKKRRDRRNISTIPLHKEVYRIPSKRAPETARPIVSPGPRNPRAAEKTVESPDSIRSCSPVRATAATKRQSREPAVSYETLGNNTTYPAYCDHPTNHSIHTAQRDESEIDHHGGNRDQSVPAAHTGYTDAEAWLRSDADYLRRVQRIQERSPTPTPVAKARMGTPMKSVPPATSRRMSPPPRMFHGDNTRFPPSNSIIHTGFTPVNRSTLTSFDLESESRSSPCLKKRIPNIRPKRISNKDCGDTDSRIIREMSLARADIITQQGFLEAKRLSQEAAEQAQLSTGGLKPDTSKQQIEPHSIGPTTVMIEGTDNAANVAEDFIASEVRTGKMHKPVSKIIARSPHVLPPSSHLPEFRYRFAGQRPSSSSSNSSSIAEEFQPVKEISLSKSQAKVVRRLSFTPNGTVKGREMKRSSKDTSASAVSSSRNSPLQRAEGIPDDQPHEEADTGANPSQQLIASLQATGNKSTTSGELPEAQIVPNQPGRLPQEPSGPSTNVLETDRQSPVKFPSMEEAVADSQWCTQAAVLRAQQSFQESVLTPVQRLEGNSRSPARQKTQANCTSTVARPGKPSSTPLLPRHQTKGILSNDLSPTASSYNEPPMSTQEMIDAVSPFPLTTVKKPRIKHRASFAPSPNVYKGATNNGTFVEFSNPKDLDMSTSPEEEVHFRSRDKPPTLRNGSALTPILQSRNPRVGLSGGASATTYRTPALRKDPSTIPSVTHPTPTASVISYSIAPNGTLTEVFQQDGQEFEIDWDLEAAIEDAGSFLGTWDVDKEVKKIASGSTGELK